MPKLSALYHFPIKSCAGFEQKQLLIDERGPAGDRLFMVTDENYCFRTQQKKRGGFTKMALIKTKIETNDGLQMITLTVPGFNKGTFLVKSITGNRQAVQVTIFNDVCDAIDQGDQIADWFSAVLEAPCRLVRMTDNFRRQCDPTFADKFAHTGFADSFPILLISDASLTDLNSRLEAKGCESVSRENFRAAFWVDGDQPYEEDTWKRIRINNIVFDVVKPCARCSITQVDWQKGEYRYDNEPLVTLRSYRHQKVARTGKSGVMFGQNLVHRATGEVHVGDAVEIME